MSIKIYTYCDPYKLKDEIFWDDIKNCPYFCVSQTLVNGLKNIYCNDYQNGCVTTVFNLVESMFEHWESTTTIIKQHTAIDNIISTGIPTVLSQTMQENIKKSFLFNREEVFNSIRILFELKVNISEILIDKLTSEQRFILDIYKAIQNSDKYRDFMLDSNFDEEYINKAIKKALEKNNKNGAGKTLDMQRVVIHGIHQFTPIVLRLIENLSKYKEVILLFNYQTQYQNIYQTWIDVYSAFDYPIITSNGKEFKPDMMLSNSYKGNLLADYIGKLVEGKKIDINCNDQYEIVEYDNLTEFANYVADQFRDAEKNHPENPLHVMREQFYAADTSVNDILKTYFPEQFGERQFLNYPLGHFFLALANMWDPVNNVITINDLNDIKECLSAGILQENYLGELSTIFNKMSSLFEDCKSIDTMISRIKRLKKNKKHLSDPTKKQYIDRISYYAVSVEEIEKLLTALEELDDLSAYFYEDFDNKAHNFKEFYKKLKNYLKDDVLNENDLGEEFADIIRRVLTRLEEVENIDASASFECLKSTMSVYLVQEYKPGKSANWIVRGFDQIEGDILRSKIEKGKIYHFACLTDEDITSIKKVEFPWPLDSEFFEVAQEPVDWKYQVYVKARKELKNFNRYALLYGLEFNRAKFKLSYVKRNGEREREPYYLLRLLGADKKIYSSTRIGNRTMDRVDFKVDANETGKFDQFDYYRYQICKYRFLTESIIENATVYKDNFLLMKYFEVLLENQVKEDLQGYPVSEVILDQKLKESYDILGRYFPFVQRTNCIDIIGNIKYRLLNLKIKAFPILKNEDRKYMLIRELFIHKQLADHKTFRKNVLSDKFKELPEEQLEKVFSEEALSNLKYKKETDVWCQYCSNREICMAYYR